MIGRLCVTTHKKQLGALSLANYRTYRDTDASPVLSLLGIEDCFTQTIMKTIIENYSKGEILYFCTHTNTHSHVYHSFLSATVIGERGQAATTAFIFLIYIYINLYFFFKVLGFQSLRTLIAFLVCCLHLFRVLFS